MYQHVYVTINLTLIYPTLEPRMHLSRMFFSKPHIYNMFEETRKTGHTDALRISRKATLSHFGTVTRMSLGGMWMQ